MAQSCNPSLPPTRNPSLETCVPFLRSLLPDPSSPAFPVAACPMGPDPTSPLGSAQCAEVGVQTDFDPAADEDDDGGLDDPRCAAPLHPYC
jgi:hypothetical protein